MVGVSFVCRPAWGKFKLVLLQSVAEHPKKQHQGKDLSLQRVRHGGGVGKSRTTHIVPARGAENGNSGRARYDKDHLPDDLLPVHPNPYLYHFPKVLFSLHMRLSLSLGQSLIISPKPTDT